MRYEVDIDAGPVAEQPSSPLTDEQREGLAKLAESISAESTESFSKIIGRATKAKVPLLAVLPLDEAVERLGGPADAVITAWMTVVGQINASVLLAFDDAGEQAMCDLLGVERYGEMANSAFAEIANIIGTRYVNGIADSCGMTFEPEPPEVASGMLGAVIGTVLSMSTVTTHYAVLVVTALEVDKTSFDVRFLFIPSDSSIEALISSLGSK